MVCWKGRRFVLLQKRTCPFGGTRKRFFCEEKEGLVCGKGRRLLFVHKRTYPFGGTRKRFFFVQKRRRLGEESNSKVGTAPVFGSGLDYNAGVASVHTSTSTGPNRVEIYLGNASNLIANGRLRVPGPGFWPSGVLFRCSAFTIKYYNTQSRIDLKTPDGLRSVPSMDLPV